jgi:serine/threonine protein kinase
MTGLEGIPLVAVGHVIYKAVVVARHIIKNYKNYLEDNADYQVTLNVEITRLDALRPLLLNPDIARSVAPQDRHSYVHIIKKLHTLLLKYVQQVSPNDSNAKQLITNNSAQNDFDRIAILDPALLQPSDEQQRFWSLGKERVDWAVRRKEKAEKLVVQVQTWGETLEKLRSATMPQIFARLNLSPGDIAKNTPDDDHGDTRIKGRLLVANRGESAAVETSMPDLIAASRDTELKSSQVDISTTGEEGRGDLGGSKRRQWAELISLDGVTKDVIVEFKDRPPKIDQNTLDQFKRELRSLVGVLRLAAKGTKTFQILYCDGFFETSSKDRYGLVYQLPDSIEMDESIRCETLTNILMNHRQLLGEDIQNGYQLAKSLTNTLFQLHSVQWVHRSFNSDNILLFGTKSHNGIQFDWSHPYLVGFDASRNIYAESGKAPSNTYWKERVYIHPARQQEERPRFRKIFDIYSLGVVLLEIGSLESMQDRKYLRNEWVNVSANDVREKLVVAAGKLKRSPGKTYAEIVTTCLEGNLVGVENDDADETQVSDAFRTQVCEKFEQIRY